MFTNLIKRFNSNFVNGCLNITSCGVPIKLCLYIQDNTSFLSEFNSVKIREKNTRLLYSVEYFVNILVNRKSLQSLFDETIKDGFSWII